MTTEIRNHAAYRPTYGQAYRPGIRMLMLASLLAVMLGVSGCVGSRSVPLANGSSVPASGVVTVRPGDTVYSIARRYGVSQRELIERNNLQPPYLLRVGERLSLSTPRRHVVRPGDTISEIAERYGVSQRDLVTQNGLNPPYLIRVGDRLSLPGSRQAQAPRSDGSNGGVIGSRAPQTVPIPPVTAGSGGSGASSAPPIRTADQGDGKPWSSGGRLYFPVPGGQAGSQTGGALGAPPVPTPRPGGSGGQTAQASASVSPASVSPTVRPTVRPKGPIGDLTPPPRSGRFIWPLEGRVIGGFGPRKSGLSNDGINIAAPAGTPIRAAENGVVVYAGNELRGFGNLLLIKHADDWVTAYAHAQTLNVTRGDRVERGQVIATVGSTGNVGRPQLHFEIRKGQRPIDPRGELPKTRTSMLPRLGNPAFRPG
jgi:murein DD-endopeptidase MepM/ murein hydrolase activator NlpD